MRLFASLILMSLLAACGTTQPSPPVINYSDSDRKFIDDYKTASGGNYKIGKAYLVNDQWYNPAQEPSYDQVGVASWYGKGLDGKPTANGEIFNSNDYTAAHPTLPMPSIVEVTNLANGKTVNVRINDRGPFHTNRIIDLSKAAADALGINGTAKVRVRLLQNETLEFMKYKPAQFAGGELNSVEPAAGDELPEEFQDEK